MHCCSWKFNGYAGYRTGCNRVDAINFEYLFCPYCGGKLLIYEEPTRANCSNVTASIMPKESSPQGLTAYSIRTDEVDLTK